MMVGRKREKLYGTCQHQDMRKIPRYPRLGGRYRGLAGPPYIERDQEEKPDEGRKPGLGGFECHPDPMPIKFLFIHISHACSAVCVLFQACHGENPFLFREELGISRCVWHEKETNHPKDCRYDALD